MVSQIYHISLALFIVFNIPVAVAQNIGMIFIHPWLLGGARGKGLHVTAGTWLVGRFLSGICGAAFLSVAGGSVSDLFLKQEGLCCFAWEQASRSCLWMLIF